MTYRCTESDRDEGKGTGMAKGRPPISRAELEIAQIVWDLGKGTVRQVHQALPKDRRVDFWTVQTYLRRLEQKGYLKVQRIGKGNDYSPAVQPRRVLRALVEDFIDRVFDGEVLPMVQHIIESKHLTDDEIDKLQCQLSRLKEDEQ